MGIFATPNREFRRNEKVFDGTLVAVPNAVGVLLASGPRHRHWGDDPIENANIFAAPGEEKGEISLDFFQNRPLY
jgi:hypothetical protein